MSFVLRERQLDQLKNILDKIIDDGGATYALLSDTAGNLLCESGDHAIDSTSLAVLSAANYAATKEIASLLNEKEFSLLFHKGESENIHFTRIGEEILLIVLFKPYLSLGLLRLKVDEAKKKINNILKA